MTYFAFLAIFLVVPIGILALLLRGQSGKHFARVPVGIKYVGIVIGLHVLLAVTWTTPWDNYLVASGVWWYDPNLVSGVTIGYVPIEEYTFFILQPILTGFWLFFIMRFYPLTDSLRYQAGPWIRVFVTLLLGLTWFVCVGILFYGDENFRYLGLILVWAIPPMMLQVAFGGDILLSQWRLIVITIVSATIYLSIADLLAIGAGTWTIDPAQSTGIFIGEILPVEEMIFFFMTNALVVFGITLAVSPLSWKRLKNFMDFVLKPRDLDRKNSY